MREITTLYDICDSLKLLADHEEDERPGLALLLKLIAGRLARLTDGLFVK